jgi:para-aminobenzoate synthetase component I
MIDLSLKFLPLQGSPDDLLRRALAFSRGVEPVCCLHSGEFKGPPPSKYDWVLAVGAKRSLAVPIGATDALLQLEFWLRPDFWTFFALSYDLKNEIEPKLNSSLPDTIGWPLLQAFEPEWLMTCQNGQVTIWADQPELLRDQIERCDPIELPNQPTISHLQPRQDKADYLDTINQLKEHIAAGDLYEVNYCQEFVAHDVSTDFEPFSAFYGLQDRMKSPFSALWHTKTHSLLSASPERFLSKIGDQLVSQPIKGTSRRHAHPLKDQRNKRALHQSEKDRAEHIMIVDLVRNDLAKISQIGSVAVAELMGLYSFARVHQMISTISGRLLLDTNFAQILRATFPMGSMTGAPKVMAMQVAERYELTRRGMYSGSIGYLAPDRDFGRAIRSSPRARMHSPTGVRFYPSRKSRQHTTIKESKKRHKVT